VARFKVVIKPSAVEEIEAVSRKKDRRRIVKRIEALGDDPRPPGVQKLSGHDRYRIRQGSNRTIYAIEDRKLSVVVVKVGHRREVYRDAL
jgi:mRNA interferase RelE/StbE